MSEQIETYKHRERTNMYRKEEEKIASTYSLTVVSVC